MRVQPPGHVGIFSGIFGCLVERHFTKRDLFLAGSAHFLEAQRRVTQMALG